MDVKPMIHLNGRQTSDTSKWTSNQWYI